MLFRFFLLLWIDTGLQNSNLSLLIEIYFNSKWCVKIIQKKNRRVAYSIQVQSRKNKLPCLTFLLSKSVIQGYKKQNSQEDLHYCSFQRNVTQPNRIVNVLYRGR